MQKIHANQYFKNSNVRTRDMGGVATTHEFTKAILDKMETL